jgi:hypothetical protein
MIKTNSKGKSLFLSEYHSRRKMNQPTTTRNNSHKKLKIICLEKIFFGLNIIIFFNKKITSFFFFLLFYPIGILICLFIQIRSIGKFSHRLHIFCLLFLPKKFNYTKTPTPPNIQIIGKIWLKGLLKRQSDLCV